MKNKREAAKVLAKVIDERTTEVRDALFDSGIKISPNADKEQLVDDVISNLGSNKRLQRKIGTLAVEVSPSSFQNTSGRRAAFRNQSNSGDNSEVGTAVIETAGQIAGVLLANYLAQKQAERSAELQQDLLAAKSASDAANADLVKQQLTLENLRLQAKTALTPQVKLFMGVLLVGALVAGL
jgi:ribosome maturation protein Sdo1